MPFKYFGENTLTALVEILQTKFAGKVDKDGTKTLTDVNYSQTDKNKLDGIEDSAQVNAIEKISVDGVEVTIEEKMAKILLPENSLPDGLKTGYVTTGAAANSDLGTKSTAEGNNNISSGAYSHTEGLGNEAEGRAAHAEGNSTKALANYAHSEGDTTTAEETCAHAEGQASVAMGKYSHAQNQGTIAAGNASTAIGKYNLEDDSMALQIGGGTATARKDILSVDWEGNLKCGKINGLDTTTIYTSANFDYSNLITKTEMPLENIVTHQQIDTTKLITTDDVTVSKLITTDDITVNKILTTDKVDVENLVTKDNIELIIASLPSVNGVKY